ncbi:MAG: LuxR C-terminal-related transcriptional regulator [Clostridiales Family XIII bacterium]|nr:LuxR C-terminal-related transcriptional regulator [Clostridiales Family XIII bacterium]
MLTQSEWERLNGLTDAIYRVKGMTAMREVFLRGLSGLIHFDFSDFELGKPQGKRIPGLVDAVVFSRYAKDFEEAFISLYENVYSEIDYVKWVFSGRESMVYRESDLIDEKARKNSAFYTEYLHPFGLVIVAGISVIHEGVFMGSVTLYRTEEKEDFSDRDMYVLHQLLPHLRNRLGADFALTADSLKNVSYMLRHHYELTPREIEIIGLIYRGNSNETICKELHIAENTVKKHVSNLFEKLRVKSRSQMIHFLIRNELNTLFD